MNIRLGCPRRDLAYRKAGTGAEIVTAAGMPMHQQLQCEDMCCRQIGNVDKPASGRRRLFCQIRPCGFFDAMRLLDSSRTAWSRRATARLSYRFSLINSGSARLMASADRSGSCVGIVAKGFCRPISNVPDPTAATTDKMKPIQIPWPPYPCGPR